MYLNTNKTIKIKYINLNIFYVIYYNLASNYVCKINFAFRFFSISKVLQ